MALCLRDIRDIGADTSSTDLIQMRRGQTVEVVVVYDIGPMDVDVQSLWT